MHAFEEETDHSDAARFLARAFYPNLYGNKPILWFTRFAGVLKEYTLLYAFKPEEKR